MTVEWREVMEHLLALRSLTEEQAGTVFERMLSGDLQESQIAAILSLIAARGPTADELTGAARVMRRFSTKITTPQDATVIDTCGTGGAAKTFNVSTAAAIVTAAASPHHSGGSVRVVVAKHGNRSRTGRGSAEVLAALGVNVDAGPDVQARCLEEAGVCFCFAIHHHPAARHAAAVRKSLGFPTIFNLLGPLTNPAGATRQLMGIYDPQRLEVVAGVLVRLGCERAMVMHSDDGLDELSITAPTTIAHVETGSVRVERFEPRSLGLLTPDIQPLRAGTIEEAAAFIRGVLDGEAGPRRDMVILNAAAALVVAGAAVDLGDGIARASQAIDSGRAGQTLHALGRTSFEKG